MIKEFLLSMEGYIQSGGIVMVPLLIISLSMWLLIINRAMFMRRLYVKNIPREKAGELVKTNQMPNDRYQGITSLLVRQFIGPKP